ncbi:transcriptional regulator with XRE-family HTH domain [Sphingomonas jejuensis]|uniref:Transcriptional regulator with XRE-family HTH domain n=1 Tax=Sphingomonas jejuensis TaxID=904715 RepID=A0ABX0XN02_9SPHN|nr:helix-turn-helix transcriptional regulator [Sphingomonas jejuensis]NJC34071.1 transcriptional regulator with XRE-family HTH domain [Sphingomonas jejuensis]
MITAIREIRKARGLTLEQVAAACSPPTTAQTIGRLEMGTRTVSVGWLNRIAAALGVTAGDLVTLPERPMVPVAARLGPDGARALTRTATAPLPVPPDGAVGIAVEASVGDYRAGDMIWCNPIEGASISRALNRDVLVPRPVGRFLFGRLIGVEGTRLQLLPPGAGARQQVVDRPAWVAQATTLVRAL